MQSTLRAFGLLLLTASLAHADGRVPAAIDEDDPRVELELLADVETVPAGEPFRVGVRFHLDPGWHVYWRNPGQSGLATDVSFEGAPTGALHWPAPERFETPGPIVTYGYSHDVLLFAEATAPDGEGPFEVKAVADFLVCEDACVPGRAEVSTTLNRGELATSSSAELFDRVTGTVPVPSSELELTAQLVAAREIDSDGAPLGLGLVACDGPCEHPALGDLQVFPLASESVLELANATVAAHPSARLGALVTFDAKAYDTLETFDAVVTWQEGETRRAAEVSLPWPPEANATHPFFANVDVDPSAPETATEPAAAPTQDLSLALALLFGMLGGLVLNLMPCVLPVLGLKVFGLVRARGEDADDATRTLRKHALGYTIGVIGSMELLAGVVLALRTAGVETGMGFQLQEPRFVAFLAVLLVVLSLSFFGVFELHVGATELSAKVDRSEGMAKSVGEGVLTVVLATPCSAPFLGTAIGFAFAGSAPVILAVFAAIGFGLALPFVLIAIFPALAKRLPKPGAWMVNLQRFLGFLLLATVIWLAWVHGQLTGVTGMTTLLGLLLTAAFATWWIASASKRWVAVLVALPLVAFVGHATWSAPRDHTPVSEAEQPWSPDAVQTSLGEGRPVLVIFTADWCLTCKANERLVLGREDVEEALEGVTVLVGDWTARDEAIRAELARHGRAGVPLYLLYVPGADHPEVWPELLGADEVLEALDRATSGRST
ncbi:MAG: protein-disulfide reductase DsbD family protein [Polyangiales bacterium]